MPVISRSYTVSLMEEERLYLWTLLLQVKGTMNTTEIRRIIDVGCCSLKEACRMQVLLSDGAKGRQVLADAYRSSFALVQLFCHVHGLLEGEQPS